MPPSASTKKDSPSKKPKSIHIEPPDEDNLSMQYGTNRAPPELGLSQADDESNAGKNLLGATKDVEESIELSELDKSTSRYSVSKFKQKDGDGYNLLHDNSIDFLEGFKRKKTGKEALLDMFLQGAEPVTSKKQDKYGAKKGLGGKRLTKAEEEEW